MRRSYARGESAVEELAVAGLPVPVTLRRHPAARRLTLRVSHTDRGVILTTPPDCNIADAGRFVSKHIDWVRRHLEDL
ncbi:MAG: M48 family metallopeptidase, partial [Hyphomicrobiaceae bacterium]